jgi:hypothetical protein
VLVADCDNPVFSGTGDMTKRHFLYEGLNKKEYAQVVSRKGETHKDNKAGFSTGNMKKKGETISVLVVVP